MKNLQKKFQTNIKFNVLITDCVTESIYFIRPRFKIYILDIWHPRSKLISVLSYILLFFHFPFPFIRFICNSSVTGIVRSQRNNNKRNTPSVAFEDKKIALKTSHAMLKKTGSLRKPKKKLTKRTETVCRRP